MTFTQMLSQAWQARNTLLCVGLDPDLSKFPDSLHGHTASESVIFEFCKTIVDATADLVCCFKPQIAYFAAQNAEDQLSALIEHIHSKHPGIPVILDAKRGDIGSTAEQYAIEAFERFKADAVTVNPYMGKDSVTPYLAYPSKGVILLCRTSNPSGSDFQTLTLADAANDRPIGARKHSEKLYEYIARTVAHEWNDQGQCGLVVGATCPEEIARVRQLVGDLPLLVPGIGAQGGDIQATVRAGQTANGTGLMINSSRAILYASQGEDYAEAARRVAQTTRDAINQYRIVGLARQQTSTAHD
ncbi:MAG: orotidine-5'-phosphate decarboxylase [Pseudomonadota bacterium]